MLGIVNVPGASAADLANKVDKVSGKGLSSNDYTTAEKNKLAGLSNYSDATTTSKGIVQVGSGLSVSNGIISVPSATTSTEGIVQKTASITSGSTDVPTADAVYSALQNVGGGVQIVTVKPYGEASGNDDIFLSSSSSSTYVDIVYSIHGNTIFVSNNQIYIWIKKSAFNLSDQYDVIDKFSVLSPYHYASANTGIMSVTNKTNYYALYCQLYTYNSSMPWMCSFKILYTP